MMITFNEWQETYKPINNPTNDWGGEYSAFETYGDDLERVKDTDPALIWTEVDGDGGCYVVAGMHWVNRIHYYICEVPYSDPAPDVVVEVWKECDCLNDEYDPDPNCKECESGGTISIYPDTKEELIEIFGEKAVNE